MGLSLDSDFQESGVPDFEVVVDGPILRLARVCERHYLASDVPDEDA